MENMGMKTVRRPQSSRMASRLRGGQVLLTGYFIAASFCLITMNAWGLSPLAAILTVWLGGGVISICIAFIIAAAPLTEITAVMGAFWQAEFGADYQRI